MVRSLRRLTRDAVALLGAVLLLVAVAPWNTVSAFANTSGNQTIGNFEIDGNLYDGLNNNTASSTPVNGVQDWVNMGTQPVLTDPVGNVDTTSFTGSKECGTDGNCQPDDWQNSTQGLASPKDDLSKVFVASRLVPDRNGDLWGYFGVERAANDGTTFFDFELNQQPNHTSANGLSVPTRSPGDVLIVAQQQGSGPKASFTISGTIQRWTTTPGDCDPSLILTGSAHGCWTAPTPLGTDAFVGLANDSTINDLPSGTLDSNLFGEFAVDLTAAGAVVGCPSTGFTTINVRTRSSISDTAEIKDYAAGPIDIPSACGELEIFKYAAGTVPHQLVPGATFTVTPNPATGTGVLTVTDGQTGDADKLPNGIIDINPAKPNYPATYSVLETVPPPGYLLPTTNNPQTVSVQRFGSGPDAATVSFDDPAIVTSLHLTKSATPTTYTAAGDKITYSYTATNTGNVNLVPPYAVSDDKVSTVTCDQTPNPLTPGASFSCTATYTIKQADVDAGIVTNHATATAKFGTVTVTSNLAQATVNALQSPALSLDKTSPDTSYDHVGQVLTYHYLLTNTGNVTLSAPYAVSDDKTNNTSCPSTPSTLAPNDSVTCSATYTVTQADLDAGSITNNASATAHKITPEGDLVHSNPDSVTISASQGPALHLDKAATESSYDAVGDVLHYTYTLTNSGNVTLTSPYGITDDKAGTHTDCSTAASPLAPGANTTCTGTYTVTQADIDAGSVTNHATATAMFGTQTVPSNEATAVVPASLRPALHLDKAANESSYDTVGDVLNYTYTLTNSGNVTLTSPYAISDDKAGTHTDCSGATSPLAPGAQTTCSGTYTVTQADLDSGSVTNHATATAMFVDQVVTSNQAEATVPAIVRPALHLDKAATESSYDAVGDVLHYTYTLTNSGNVTLTSPYAISDDKAGTHTDCTTAASPLAPGANTTCTGTYTVTQADIDAGSVTNHATATANFNGTPVGSNEAQATVPADLRPALSLDKTSPDGSYNHVGQVLTYNYLLTNTGNVTLHEPYAVSDDRANNTNCPTSPASIAPGESVTCSATYTVTQADLDAGSITNHASATAHEVTADGALVHSNPDQLTIQAAQAPALHLDKAATESSYDTIGDVLHYSYTLTNTGNVSLTSPYSISDDKAGTHTDCSTAASPLAPGANTTCTGTYTVTQADIDAGSVTNHATATATFGDRVITSNEAEATVPAIQHPLLTLVKTAGESSYNAAGAVLNYTYTLTNSGNVTLSAPYAISDDKTANTTCPSVPATLAPGASVQCQGTYTTTQADVDAGSVTNHATGTAQFGDTPVTSNEAQATVPAVQTPALLLVKNALEPNFSAAGTALHYTYLLTNTGNVTLSAPYAVADDKAPSVDCPTTPATLAPGESVQCTATYSATQGDVDAGSVTNHATGTAVFGETTVTSNEAQATVPAVQSPALTLVKAVDKSTASYGDTLTYTFTATNTGNTDLTGVVVTDVIPTGTTYVDGSASPNATFDSASKTVSWTVGNLAAGAAVNTLTFKVTIDKPSFNSTVGLPAEVIDNVGAIKADTVSELPSNHVKTPVTAVLGVKIVKKTPKKAPKVLPFTGLGLPLPLTTAVALSMIGAGVALASVRRRRQV